MGTEEATRVETKLKGVNFRSFMKAFLALRGAGAVERMLVDLPTELGGALRYGGIVAGGWYPVAWYRLMHASAQRVTGSGHELARAIGVQSRKDDFTGVYRLVAFVVSPESLFKNAARVYRLYDSMGVAEIVEARPGMVRARYHSCVGYDANVFESSVGGAIGILEACGAEAVRVMIIDGGKDGDDEVTFEIRWV